MNKRILRIIFDGFASENNTYSKCILMANETLFSRSWLNHTISEKGFVACSEIEIDLLNRSLCKIEGGDFWDAYIAAEDNGVSFTYFQEPSFSNVYQFNILRFSESDFEEIILHIGGSKIPETVTKTPDFKIGNCVIELKDLQIEGLYDQSRRQAIAKIFEKDQRYSICLNHSAIHDQYSVPYKRLISNSIKNSIKKAANQIKEYAKTNEFNAAGIILINTGYFSLEHSTFKAIVEDILFRETTTIKFAYIFTQSVIYNAIGDLQSDYQQNFIGAFPENLKIIEQTTLDLIQKKMAAIFHADNSQNLFVTPKKPIAFFLEGKFFYWTPERIEPSINF